MPAVDELAEINGIKPRRFIAKGEVVNAPSMTSDDVYIVRRTGDKLSCSCTAWSVQSKVPAEARTCKHLRKILGDEYEDARLKLKNPDGIGVPPKKEKGAASRGKGKRKKGDDNDGDNDKPKKKRARTRRLYFTKEKRDERFTP